MKREDSYFFFFLGLMLPGLMVFTPLVPPPLRTIVIAFWMVIVPFMLFSIRSNKSLVCFVLAIIFLMSRSFTGIYIDIQYWQLYFLPLVMFVYVVFSTARLSENSCRLFLEGGFYGAGLINAITLGTLILITMGTLDAQSIFEAFGNDVSFGLARFSLGNAIEVPFLLTLFTILGVSVFSRRTLIISLLVVLNITLALVSQSRGVIAISVLHGLIYLGLSWRSWIIGGIAITAFLSTQVNEELLVIGESLVARFSGEDYGSGSTRLRMLAAIVSGSSALSVIFGSGIFESSDLMVSVVGGFATAESIFLQLFYDFGLVGLAFTVLPCVFRVYLRSNLNFLVTSLVVAQMFLLLPVTSSIAVMICLLLMSKSNLHSLPGGRSAFTS